MSLTPADHCDLCDCVLNYRDEESGILYVQQRSHTDDDCALMVRDLKRALKTEIIRLNKLVDEERTESKAMELRSYNKVSRLKQRIEELESNLVKAPLDQKKKLIDQCHRWQALYERERMRRREMRKEIMHLYGTLDFKVETGSIVDTAAKVVAEYTITKLRELTRKNR